jgi:hypothetical protein
MGSAGQAILAKRGRRSEQLLRDGFIEDFAHGQRQASMIVLFTLPLVDFFPGFLQAIPNLRVQIIDRSR